MVSCVSLTSKWLLKNLERHPTPAPTPTPKELRFTLHCEYGLGADFSSTVPGLTGICACVLWEYLLDTQAVPATLLFKVEVF